MLQIENVPDEVKNADVIFASHSGGKDSQAMLAALIRCGLKEKIVLVHSDLGEMEWEEMAPWIDENSFGLKCHIVKSQYSFFDIVRKYGRFPSTNPQFCTMFLKTNPICDFIHDYMNKNNLKTAVNCTGIRAEESIRRRNKIPFTISDMHKPRKHKNHFVWDYLPIFDYDLPMVKKEIHNAGQKLHWVYSQGFSRLSCVFCVNGRKGEHEIAAKLRPELGKKIAQLEREIGKTYRLKQIKGKKYNKYMDEYLSFCGE
jgi:DNA sulfur modification protein DndC